MAPLQIPGGNVVTVATLRGNIVLEAVRTKEFT